ncbi:MAG: MarR family winged helix-turn-helix transcriptional regulator [Senegalia sp. (in: firmicutes)]|uniref:MarR family winged helix-turn-helix transcriptional regulator n=1 Tax=Senegalia sp. (in: firmicutes) TaxID=1924098 RepID=UPI003F943246
MGTNLTHTNNNLLEFTALFHSKIGKIFRTTDYKEYNCNKNQNRAIMTLGRHKELSPSTLGNYLGMRKGSLTSLIDSLIEKELLTREIDKKDRRKYLLSLTEKGENYMKYQKEIFDDAMKILYENLNEKEIENFSSSMELIVDLMKKM